jgi:hypothetical protein
MVQRKFPDWATTFIADIGNGDPNRTDPGATKQANGWAVEKPLLQTMNWLQNLFGHFVRANNEFKLEATGYEAEAGEIILMDNSTGVCTLNLPVSPIDGQWVTVGAVEKYSVQAVTVSGNGNDIMVAADTSMSLDIDKHMFKFYWREADSRWYVTFAGIIGDQI